MKRKEFLTKTLWSSAAFTLLPEITLKAGNVSELKKVVLIGDSIRVGYQPFVVKNLESVATIWAPDENGKTTNNVIYNLNGWVKNQNPDIIHINAGLHDIRTLSWELGPGHTLVKPKHYQDNLETIFTWINKYVGCKIIWATTTPVIDENAKRAHQKARDYKRHDSDVKKINKIANRIARKYNIPVNDLYSFVKEKVGLQEVGDDGVHFTESGYKQLGARVAEVVRENL